MNLREITKKVGRNIGLNLPAVQLFTKQLLLALHHFRDCGVLHADIKPDNILINDRHNAVKVCALSLDAVKIVLPPHNVVEVVLSLTKASRLRPLSRSHACAGRAPCQFQSALT